MKIRSDIQQFVKLLFSITIISLSYSSIATFIFVISIIVKANIGPSDKYHEGIIQPLMISIVAIFIVTLIVKIIASFRVRKRKKSNIEILNKNVIAIIIGFFALSLVVADIGVEMAFYASGVFFPDLIFSHKIYMAGLYISLASVMASLVVVLGSRYNTSAKNSDDTVPN